MKKVVLVGNPNVGKSLLFSRITGIGVVTANYAGTTVGVKVGKFKYKDFEYELIDAPGLYSLETHSKAETTAIKLINEADVIINVLDATNLERNLNLTLQLIKLKKPLFLSLNLWEDTQHKGITIDNKKLSEILGIDVIPTSALEHEGITEVIEAIETARVSSLDIDKKLEENGIKNICGNGTCGKDCVTCNYWSIVGLIVSKVQSLKHRHHTFGESLSDFTLHPIGGLITAFIVLFTTLLIVRTIGESVTSYVLEPFYHKLYAPLIFDIEKLIPYPMLNSLLFGTSSDPLQSFGIFTSGVYIALVLVFPYFFSFYIIFGFLEDLGYLPRLAIVLDNFFHKLGLHGNSSIPIMLGLGCKVPALMSTRVLTTQREKILTVALILMAAPCLPQSAMIVSLGMQFGIHIVLLIFALLLLFSIIVNLLLNLKLKGDSADLFIEIPSYRLPSFKLMSEKLKIRIIDYFAEVLPLIITGVVIMNILDKFGVIDFVTKALRTPVNYVMGLPPDITSVMLLGFLRKDVSIALLAPLKLCAHQFVIASIFLVLYIPCISSFFTLIKELGVKSALKVVAVIFTTSITVAMLLHCAYMLTHLKQF
ncbi:ferrous iron transporter B [bacterium]|nr:ferrous iron transporter B [bacterium]